MLYEVITTGVVTVMDLLTMLTVAQVAPQSRGPAPFDVGQRSPVTG